jgi:hypothetical protein
MDLVEQEEENDIIHKEFWSNPDGKNKLLYAFTEQQLEAREHFVEEKTTDITDLRGQVRSGKSVACARFIISLAWQHNQSEWAVMSDSLKEGGRSTYKLLFEQLPNCPEDEPEESPIVEYYNRTEKRMKLVNGSILYLVTSNNPDGLKGSELNGAWMDEIAFYKDLMDTINTVMERQSAKPRYGVVTSTTAEGYNDYYDIFELGQHPQTEQDISMNIETVHLDLESNAFLPDERVEQLKRSSSRKHLGGEFSAEQGRVYETFTKNTHVKTDVSLSSDWRIYAYDSGWDDPRVVLEIGKTKEGQLVILDEFYRSESEAEDAIRWMQNRPSGKIYSEHDPEHMHKFRRELGYPVESAYKKIDEGIQSVKERLGESNGVYGLVVHENAKNTIQEFLSYTKDEVGSTVAQDHAMDCIRYAIATPRERELKQSDSRLNFAIRKSSSNGSKVKKGNETSEEENSDGGVPSIDDITEEDDSVGLR